MEAGDEWAYRMPSGKQVRICDLPIDRLERVAKKHDVGWYALMGTPAAHPLAALDVYALACSTVSEEPAEVNTPRQLLDLLDTVESDLPSDYEGGLPLSPTGAEDETTTV